MKTILVTGCAGFIGSHLVEALIKKNIYVIGYDNFFSRSLINAKNIVSVTSSSNFRLVSGDIRDYKKLRQVCENYRPSIIVHLAALGGVRRSFNNQKEFYSVNVDGTKNVLKLCELWHVDKLVFASSSSVYGNDSKDQSSEIRSLINPISPYAKTKVIGESLCNNFSIRNDFSIISCRFFSVYGPRQRPDMAIASFVNLLYQGKPIPVYGDGTASRDFTYVADVINGIVSSIDTSLERHTAINIGSNRPVSINMLLQSLATITGITPLVTYLPHQLGDVDHTNADIELAKSLLKYIPSTDIEHGLRLYLHSLGVWKFAA